MMGLGVLEIVGGIIANAIMLAAAFAAGGVLITLGLWLFYRLKR